MNANVSKNHTVEEIFLIVVVVVLGGLLHQELSCDCGSPLVVSQATTRLSVRAQDVGLGLMLRRLVSKRSVSKIVVYCICLDHRESWSCEPQYSSFPCCRAYMNTHSPDQQKQLFSFGPNCRMLDNLDHFSSGCVSCASPRGIYMLSYTSKKDYYTCWVCSHITTQQLSAG